MKTWIAQLACGKRLRVSAVSSEDAAESAALAAGWVPSCGLSGCVSDWVDYVEAVC